MRHPPPTIDYLPSVTGRRSSAGCYPTHTSQHTSPSGMTLHAITPSSQNILSDGGETEAQSHARVEAQRIAGGRKECFHPISPHLLNQPCQATNARLRTPE